MITLNLDIRLNQILELIPNISEFKWSVFEFEGIGENAYVFENEVNKSNEIYYIDLIHLQKFDAIFFQIINLVLFGDKQFNNFNNSYQCASKNCEVRIELVDSSFWEISIKNKSIERNIKNKLKLYLLDI